MSKTNSTQKFLKGTSDQIENTTLEYGQPAFATDTNELFVGDNSGVPQKITNKDLISLIDSETSNRKTADNNLQQNINNIKLVYSRTMFLDTNAPKASSLGSSKTFRKDVNFNVGSGTDTNEYKYLNLDENEIITNMSGSNLFINADNYYFCSAVVGSLASGSNLSIEYSGKNSGELDYTKIRTQCHIYKLTK